MASPLTIDSLLLNGTAGSGAYVIDASGGMMITTGGIMMTSLDTTTGDNATILGGTLGVGANEDLVVVQSNTQNSLTISSTINVGGGFGLVKEGAGSLVLTGAASYTGKAFLYGGKLGISDLSDLGTPASFVANQVNLGGHAAVPEQHGSGGQPRRDVECQCNYRHERLQRDDRRDTSGINAFGFTKIGTGVLTLAASSIRSRAILW